MGVLSRNVQRRATLMSYARLDRGFTKRDITTVLATSHNDTSFGYSENTSVAQLFSSNNSCLLMPEVTQGPYYVGGEYIREDIRESQEGVDITLDYQVIDVDTCEPVPNVYVEIWHCNSTGVYSGVVANGNGDSSDESNIDNTFLRGIVKTDNDGVAQFQSLFPGFYTGRTNHIHVMVHANATEYANKTLGNEVYASHVGQAFFDQTLIQAVMQEYPYSDNTQSQMMNADDSILSEEAGTDNIDPLMSYSLLGDTVADGLLAWLAFGINTSYTNEVTPAAFLYQSGGVENQNSGMGGGPGGGNGGPGGPPPSGSAGSGGSSSTEAPTSGAQQTGSIQDWVMLAWVVVGVQVYLHL
ncbi:hypothetical protein K4F52_008748 [Lecanicillium sp. MT-2017a]|nr:hypothetical protein K4F52_008748 [Lecanicillium sp. MT-2017a]